MYLQDVENVFDVEWIKGSSTEVSTGTRWR